MSTNREAQKAISGNETQSKKYELTNEYIEKETFRDGQLGKIKLYRIRALSNFANVQKGELGGFIEKEDNLTQEGGAWVYDNAHVYYNARVQDNARICDVACVSGNAWISDNARVWDNACISGDALVCGDAQVCKDADIYGDVCIGDGALICRETDILWISEVGSSSGKTTIFKNRKGGLNISYGTFYGTLEQFVIYVEVTHGNSRRGRECKAMVAFVKIHFDIE